MTRTDQAHSWIIYIVLGMVTTTLCYAFLFTDKLDAAAFTGIASTIVMFFFGKAKPGETNGTSAPTPRPSSSPPPTP